ncbi:MAG TPA: FAD:protein FMN transferase [Bryobacteraceae bacterium]|nr:FAD:protein FMN transferase [Bryobacteraceae bacterium]
MALQVAGAGELQRFEAVEPHMGTLVRITLYAPDAATASHGFKAAFGRIRQLDETLSDYKPDSELSRLRAGPAVRVSADLYRVLTAAQRIAKDTNGAFDVTLGPAVRLWRAARREGRLPSEQERRAALAKCGYQSLELKKKTVRMLKAGMQLDVGGIAKGYAAGEALAVLGALHMRRALVAVSGDLAIGAPPPGKRGWRVQARQQTLELRNCAVSTSGDREQFVEVGGKRYSHIIDPKTAIGLESSQEVTVIARQGSIADALATAISVMGKEGWQPARHYHARIVTP